MSTGILYHNFQFIRRYRQRTMKLLLPIFLAVASSAIALPQYDSANAPAAASSSTTSSTYSPEATTAPTNDTSISPEAENTNNQYSSGQGAPYGQRKGFSPFGGRPGGADCDYPQGVIIPLFLFTYFAGTVSCPACCTVLVSSWQAPNISLLASMSLTRYR